ncbi:MAG: polysaccharide biosynthesis protein [Bacteroidetes bacterium]|nr:MAG: polysaccharide biosynthesis protein [Bacteroidota bacterium]
MSVSDKYTSRIVIFLLDAMICVVSLGVAFVIRFDFELTQEFWNTELWEALLLLVPLQVLFFFIFRTFDSIIRFSSSSDYLRILLATVSSALLALVVREALALPISRGVLLIDYILLSFALIAERVGISLILDWYRRSTAGPPSKAATNLLLVGNETEVRNVFDLVRYQQDGRMSVRGIILLDRGATRKRYFGVRLYGIEELEGVLKSKDVERLIICNVLEDMDLRNQLIDTSLREKVVVYTAPNLTDWMEGKKNFEALKPIDVNELLMRPPIRLSKDNISTYIRDKVVLITGAAGSIGSEIVRQVVGFQPKRIVLFDQAETPLYEIDLELKEELGFFDFELIIGSGTDGALVRRIFDSLRPETVFHAAAYKHVPMMENNPYEAVENNVRMTKLLADTSIEYGVDKFVMVSTDKAVNPTNVMGATKRLCELYVQSLPSDRTKFISTRFGNVLGSNGSVIQRFTKQIEAGGPVTVTHAGIIRYFMSIPEACQLVLEAGAIGDANEIYVFDMGKPQKILKLAERMIFLKGLIPNQDIRIEITGLRPGEKLYEEVLADDENNLPTHHPKILRARQKRLDYASLQSGINSLLDELPSLGEYEIVAKMKALVPEFKSQNSRFESVDRGDASRHEDR